MWGCRIGERERGNSPIDFAREINFDIVAPADFLFCPRTKRNDMYLNIPTFYWKHTLREINYSDKKLAKFFFPCILRNVRCIATQQMKIKMSTVCKFNGMEIKGKMRLLACQSRYPFLLLLARMTTILIRSRTSIQFFTKVLPLPKNLLIHQSLTKKPSRRWNPKINAQLLKNHRCS